MRGTKPKIDIQDDTRSHAFSKKKKKNIACICCSCLFEKMNLKYPMDNKNACVYENTTSHPLGICPTTEIV